MSETAEEQEQLAVMQFSDLTPNQRAAVECLEGPLLILAGPGSGKTRVVTRRIAHLIETGVQPHRILAITFTNKAAREMGERVQALIPGTKIWISTFHSFCARLLRQHSSMVGLGQNFTIYDTTDQQQLLRQVLRNMDIDPVHYPPGRVSGTISKAKNDMETAEMFSRRYAETVGDHYQAVVAKVYPEYQKQLLKSNAVDFDDLLIHVVSLLQENPELRQELDHRFQYVLVDEYQDTNMAQYQIVLGLSQEIPNLCVTGDPDQSIYGWRGARIENILRFEQDFPQAKTIRLEQNFRSTGEILAVADSLIAHNRHRKHKELITDNPLGDPVQLLSFESARQEADEIAQMIRNKVDAGERTFSEFAIFYRVNSLSRPLEMALTKHRIPFQIAAGVSFYDRTEIKDLLAYLRLVENPNDQIAFARVINTPPRGIGSKTQGEIRRFAAREEISLMEAAARAEEIESLSARAVRMSQDFSRMMDEFSLANAGSIEKLLSDILDRTRYAKGWEGSQQEEDEQRMSNVLELVTAAREYDRAHSEDLTLEGFLETTALASEVDNLNESAGQVTMMTLHSAKGLEFPVVYLIGLEQNILPHERALKTELASELEEERRLLFVGITRAQEELYLTQSKVRSVRGRDMLTIPSDFLREMTLTLTSFLRNSSPTDFDPEESNYADYHDEEYSNEAKPSSLTRKRKMPKVPLKTLEELKAQMKTGEELEAGSKGGITLPQGFAVNMKVRHPKYGSGTVIKIGGFARDRTVTVVFDEGNFEQTFIASKCPLQPIGLE